METDNGSWYEYENTLSWKCRGQFEIGSWYTWGDAHTLSKATWWTCENLLSWYHGKEDGTGKAWPFVDHRASYCLVLGAAVEFLSTNDPKHGPQAVQLKMT